VSLSYYIPELRGVRPEDIEKAGLSHAFPGGLCAFVHCDGPDGGNGCVVTIESHGCGYFPGRQKWIKAPGAKWWIGVEGETLPADLERKEVIDGHLVKLEDGNEWLIPAARSFGRALLPRVLTADTEGNKVKEPLARFTELSADAERIAIEVYSPREDWEPGHVPVDEDEIEDMAIRALLTNYRVSVFEVLILRLVTTANALPILRALVDYPTFLAWVKSAEGNATDVPATSSSDDGGSD
jgi:hypothetical protein